MRNNDEPCFERHPETGEPCKLTGPHRIHMAFGFDFVERNWPAVVVEEVHIPPDDAEALLRAIVSRIKPETHARRPRRDGRSPASEWMAQARSVIYRLTAEHAEITEDLIWPQLEYPDFRNGARAMARAIERAVKDGVMEKWTTEGIWRCYDPTDRPEIRTLDGRTIPTKAFPVPAYRSLRSTVVGPPTTVTQPMRREAPSGGPISLSTAPTLSQPEGERS